MEKVGYIIRRSAQIFIPVCIVVTFVLWYVIWGANYAWAYGSGAAAGFVWALSLWSHSDRKERERCQKKEQ